MKRDEVQEAFGRGMELARSNVRTIAMAAGGIAVLVLLIVGVRFYLGVRAAGAFAQLETALAVYRAPIEAVDPRPEDVDDPSFPDEASRQARAVELLTAVHEKYGSTAAGGLAGVYLAELATEEGELERARQLWTGFLARHDDHVMAASVKLNLISLDRQEGRNEELAAELRESLEQQDGVLPQDAVLYHLGLTLEELGNDEEAQETFRRLIDDFPRSPYTIEARQYVDPPPGTAGTALPFGT